MDQEPAHSSEPIMPQWEETTINDTGVLVLDAPHADVEGITPSVLVMQGRDGKWIVGTDIKTTDDEGFVESTPSFFSERDGYPTFSSQEEAQKSAEQLGALFTSDANRYDIKLALKYDTISSRWEVDQDKLGKQ